MHATPVKTRGELKAVSNTIDDKKPAERYPKVTVRLTDELKEAIDEIADFTNAKSPSQAVRQAIVMYHALLSHKDEGHEPCILLEGEPIENRIQLFESAED